MAGTTAVYGLRWQDLLDPPDGPNLGKHLAEDVEDELIRIDAKDPLFIRKLTDETISANNTTLQSDDDLTFSVPINTVHTVEGLIVYTSTTVADFKFGFSFPALASLTWTGGGHVVTGSAGAGDFATNVANRLASDSTFSYGGGDAFVCSLQIKGLFIMGATAGSLTARWAKATAQASDTVVKFDSWLKLTPV